MHKKTVTDTHLHSIISHDGHSELSMICRSAVERGISIICLTDHVDTEHNHKPEFWQDIDFSFDSVKAIESISNEAGITVLNGTELGQAIHYPDVAKKVMAMHDYDQIILSQHNAFDESEFYYIDAERVLSDGDMLMRRYIEELIESVKREYGDTLAHLTYPCRYYYQVGHPCDMTLYTKEVKELFALLIKKNIALECNTSGLRQPIGCTLPEESILRLYYDMGGRLITIGSDAHRAGDVGLGIPEATELLKKIGFKEAFYYKKRNPQPYKL